MNVERPPISTGPFNRDVNSIEDKKKRDKRAKRTRLNGVVRIWLYVFAIWSSWSLVFVDYIKPGYFDRARKRSEVLDPVVLFEEEEEDLDYEPGGDRLLWDNESVVESDMSDADSESDTDREIFDLAKDIQLHEMSNEPSPILQRSLDFFQNITEPGIVTRSQRRSVFQSHEPASSSRRGCVCCYIEPRRIILHPCGCLCLCEDCRQMMAARKYLNCPCCRRVIEGFSRFYEP